MYDRLPAFFMGRSGPGFARFCGGRKVGAGVAAGDRLEAYHTFRFLPCRSSACQKAIRLTTSRVPAPWRRRRGDDRLPACRRGRPGPGFVEEKRPVAGRSRYGIRRQAGSLWPTQVFDLEQRLSKAHALDASRDVAQFVPYSKCPVPRRFCRPAPKHNAKVGQRRIVMSSKPAPYSPTS